MKVTEKAKRPGRPGELCFYCGQPVGAEHLDTCVNISKTVVVRMIIDYEIRVPAHWNAYDVESHRNEQCFQGRIRERDRIMTTTELL